MLTHGALYFDGGEFGHYGVFAGSEILKTITEAIDLALIDPTGSVSFEFSGVIVTVEQDSDLRLILRDWYRALDGYISRVDAHPTAILSLEELASDQLIREEKAQRRARKRTRG